MNQADKTNFAQALAVLAEIHTKKLSPQFLDAYWNALKKYEYKEVMRSLNQLVVDPDVGQFMPKPADIVRYIEGNNETKALVAWGKVMRAIREVGAWESVIFDDSKIHAVIMDMGGWIELCRKTTRELDFMAREFEKRYCSYQYRGADNYPVKLIGRSEQVNAYQNGNAIIKPRLIGVQKNHISLDEII